jgi:hypothetical protein
MNVRFPTSHILVLHRLLLHPFLSTMAFRESSDIPLYRPMVMSRDSEGGIG